MTILAILGPGSADIVSSGNAAEDKASLDGFAQAYQVMNRWRKLGDGSELLLVGADNQAFPIPLTEERCRPMVFRCACWEKGDPGASHRPGRDRRHLCLRSAGAIPGSILLPKTWRREAVRAEVH